MLEIGEIVKLNSEKEYIVINIMDLYNTHYVFLISNSKPLDIVVATEKIQGEDIVLQEVKDNDELDYILSQFVLTEELETEID